MNRKTIAALFVASTLAAAPGWLSAQDKPASAAKPATPAKAAAPVAPAAAAAPAADAKAEPKAEGADAAWKELQAVKDPVLDRTKTQDQEYVQKYVAERQATMTKRKELASAFVEKYPDSAHVPDALFIKAQGAASQEEFTSAGEAFLKAAPADPRGAMILSTLARLEKDEAKQLQMNKDLVAKYPGTPAAEQAKAQLKLAEAVGKPFELSFTDAISGKEISVKGLKGKVIVVDFWATWCGPCVAEMPKMKELYAEFKTKGVEFIGVSLDQPEAQGGLTKLKEFVAKNEIGWPQYYQGNFWDSEFSKGWGVNSIPCVFVVDAEGNLATTQARGKLEELLPKLLDKAPKKQASAAPLPF